MGERITYCSYCGRQESVRVYNIGYFDINTGKPKIARQNRCVNQNCRIGKINICEETTGHKYKFSLFGRGHECKHCGYYNALAHMVD